MRTLVRTPSYLIVNVPPSELSLLSNKPASRTYRENQFRMATILVTWHAFVFSDRSMYLRRFSVVWRLHSCGCAITQHLTFQPSYSSSAARIYGGGPNQ